MVVVITLGVVTVLLAYLAQWQKRATSLKIAFVLIFLFLALRYNFGNDYNNYLIGFMEISSNAKIFLTDAKWEPGWRFLHIIFRPFGFFAMVGTLALIHCIILYRFVRRYVPPKYYWLALFIYIFEPYLMLIECSAMRQTVAISLFLLSIDFLIRKKAIGYFICILIGISMHKSALVLLPVFVLAFFQWRLTKPLALGYLLCFISLFIFGEQLFPYIIKFTDIFFHGYVSEYRGGRSFSSGIGLMFMLFQLISILYYSGLQFKPQNGWDSGEMESEYDIDYIPYDTPESDLSPSYNTDLTVKANRILFLFAILTYMFIPLGLMIGMVGRVNLYFLPALIVVFPLVLNGSKSAFFRLAFLSALIFFTLFKFMMFFYNPLWERFTVYHTIFSAPQIY